MKKLYLVFILILITSVSSLSQAVWSVKAGGGTSWVIFPKVFLLDPDNIDNVWEMGPSTNSGTFYMGGEVMLPIGDHWFVAGGLLYNYVSGKVKVTALEFNISSTRLQNYSRLELPLLFGVKSSDDFWVTFGPSVFITLADNDGLYNAINDLAPASFIDTSRPIGIKAHVGIGLTLTENLFLEVNFDSDLGRRFDFVGDMYEVRLSMQSFSVGFGWEF